MPARASQSTTPALAESDDLAALHRRFGRSVLLVYLGAAALALTLFVVEVASNRAHEQVTARDTLLLGTETRAYYLGRELAQLAGELRRLGLHPDTDGVDDSFQREKARLRIWHEHGNRFKGGVAIIDRDGRSQWSLPADFWPDGKSVAADPWFADALRANDVQVVPLAGLTDRPSRLYLVAPMVRGGVFAGVLIGCVEVVAGGELDPELHTTRNVATLIATSDGGVLYPHPAPALTAAPAWRELFGRSGWAPFQSTFGDTAHVVAAAPIAGADLFLVALIAADVLDAPGRARLHTRLIIGMGTAVVPLVLLVLFLRRTLGAFAAAQGAAARGERFKLVGEAANLIAHEIKNSLNGLQLGLDLVTRPRPVGAETGAPVPKSGRAIAAVKTELTRLSSFTTRLLTFSKGVVPRPQPLALGAFVRKVCDLYVEQAAEAGIALSVSIPNEPPTGPMVYADSALVHILISNLVANALDALAGAVTQPGPCIAVTLTTVGPVAELRVVDNGPGVAASVRSRLFEPFVTGKPSGVGIGLALSRKIARAHGGQLVLESTARGASFLWTLPLSEDRQ